MNYLWKIDQNLELWTLNEEGEGENLLFSKERIKMTLELSESFAGVWQELYNLHLKSASAFYYFVGSHSSFTDARVIFIWLKSSYFFKNVPYFVKINNVDMDYVLNPTDLFYERSPNITKKNFN
jgi:hypothetical protein